MEYFFDEDRAVYRTTAVMKEIQHWACVKDAKSHLYKENLMKTVTPIFKKHIHDYSIEDFF